MTRLSCGDGCHVTALLTLCMLQAAERGWLVLCRPPAPPCAGVLPAAVQMEHPQRHVAINEKLLQLLKSFWKDLQQFREMMVRLCCAHCSTQLSSLAGAGFMFTF